ncbi:unnamed protein product [Cochlearia groenlandica]
MAATRRSSGSSQLLRSLSSSSHCNLNIRLKINCLCSHTTHPGSFRCAFHRRLQNPKIGTLVSPPPSSKRDYGLNLRKFALANSLERIGGVEAERLRRSLTAGMVKPSSYHHIRLRSEFRPRPSRFLRKEQDS